MPLIRVARNSKQAEFVVCSHSLAGVCIVIVCVVCCAVDVCSLAAAAGDCDDYRSTWYYDKSTDRCLKFVYGGCGGNDNRFDSQDACERRCRISKADVNGLGENQQQCSSMLSVEGAAADMELLRANNSSHRRDIFQASEPTVLSDSALRQKIIPPTRQFKVAVNCTVRTHIMSNRGPRDQLVLRELWPCGFHSSYHCFFLYTSVINNIFYLAR